MKALYQYFFLLPLLHSQVNGVNQVNTAFATLSINTKLFNDNVIAHFLPRQFLDIWDGKVLLLIEDWCDCPLWYIWNLGLKSKSFFNYVAEAMQLWLAHISHQFLWGFMYMKSISTYVSFLLSRYHNPIWLKVLIMFWLLSM